MAVPGRGRLEAPPDCRPSRKVRDNHVELEKPAKKHVKSVKSVKFIHPHDIEEESLPSDADSELEVPPVLKDVSQEEFAISLCIMLDNVEIDADSDDVVLGQFSYCNLNNKSVKDVARATAKGRKDYEWLSTAAVLGGRGITKGHERMFKVNDEEGWKLKVENAVEKSMRNGRQDVMVKLMFRYKNVVLDETTDSEDENPRKKKKGQVHIHVFTK